MNDQVATQSPGWVDGWLRESYEAGKLQVKGVDFLGADVAGEQENVAGAEAALQEGAD